MSFLNSRIFEYTLFGTGILSLFSTLLIGKTSLIFILIISILIIIAEFIFSFRKNSISLPYTFLIFTPITMLHYSSIRDFQIRIFTFIFIAYIISFALLRTSKIVQNKKYQKTTNLSPFKIWLIAFIIFSITSTILFYKGVYLSGDEPDFLTTTQSIINDRDFELKNNYKEESYFELKPELKGTNWKITPHITMYKNNTRSFHMPGVSFLMVPFYGIYKILDSPIHPGLFFRYSIAFYNALFALSLFFLLKIYFSDKNIFSFWLITITSFPLLFHSITIFPELPAALMSINIFIFGFTKYKNYFLTGLFLALLPWFHVKYYPFVLVFTIAIGIQLFSEWKITKKYKDILVFIILPAISLILLMAYCKILYGTINPTQIFPKQNYFVDPLLKIKVFFAYFIDQKDGLFSYAPYLFLFFFGFKHKLKFKLLLVISSTSYVLLHAFTTVRGAYAPAGRPLIFVVWIFILFIANFYFNSPNREESWRIFIFKLLTGFTYFIVAWIFYYPFFMFQPVFSGTKNRTSDILNFLGSDTIDLSSFFPSFLTHPEDLHFPNFVWIFSLIIIIGIFYLRKKTVLNLLKKRRQLQLTFAVILFICSIFSLSYYPHIHLQKNNLFKIGTIPIYKTAKLFHYLKNTKEKHSTDKLFRLKEGYSYDLFVELSSKNNYSKKLFFKFKGKTKTNLSMFSKNQLISKIINKKEMNYKIKLSSLNKLRIKNRIYGHISINTNENSNNSDIYLNLSAIR